MVDINILEINYFQNDIPVPYKLNKGNILYIHPIKVKDYPMYEWCKFLLEVDKNSENDIESIRMSNLEYLIHKVLNKNQEYQDRFGTLFNLCCKKFIAISKDKGKDCLIVCDEDGQIEGVITSKEFNEIKKIILFQNDKDYDDRYVNPEVKAEFEKYMKLRTANGHNPTLEEQKTYTMSRTGYYMNDINNMTYRTFIQIFNHCLKSEIYLAQKIIQASFKYDIKEDYKHPLFEERVDKYKEMFKDAESFENKVQQVNG